MTDTELQHQTTLHYVVYEDWGFSDAVEWKPDGRPFWQPPEGSKWWKALHNAPTGSNFQRTSRR
jgi:hypothetical protein